MLLVVGVVAKTLTGGDGAEGDAVTIRGARPLSADSSAAGSSPLSASGSKDSGALEMSPEGAVLSTREKSARTGGLQAGYDPAHHGGGSSVSAEDASATDSPVDLNQATREQLESLPGIGPVLAGRILDWRSEYGRFRSVEDLLLIRGIGEKRLATLRTRVTIGP